MSTNTIPPSRRRPWPWHRHVAPGPGALERRASRAPLLRPDDRPGAAARAPTRSYSSQKRGRQLLM
jgi:hypothetical protein